MGTDLQPIANHAIIFQNRQYREIAEEIKRKLDALELHENPFLRHHQLWQAHVYNWKRTEEEIFAKIYWTNDEEFDLTVHNGLTIELEGPVGLNLDFCENLILFVEPSYRYCEWFEPRFKQLRDEWRKYMYLIATTFGGNRVIYLADNAHTLDQFRFFQGNFEEMERAMEQKLGKPKKQFAEILDDYDNAYLTDYFVDLDFNEKVDFNKILPFIKLERKQSNYFNSNNNL